MAEFGLRYQLKTMLLNGPPMQEMFAPLGPNPTSVVYEVNPSVLELLKVSNLKVRVLINIWNSLMTYTGHSS